MTDKPAPCPWCKKPMFTWRLRDSRRLLMRCENDNCGACGPARKTENGAIKAWNRIAEAHRERA